uniref:FGGY_N domain-containing protein n=1 Tax=Angiostrongylus cantonensis TaxID=6313 RepID=A0A158PB67_ANGCA
MSCTIGIDLGTTTVKVCAVKEERILTECQVPHQANINGRLGVQDARKIIETAESLLKKVVMDVNSEHSEVVSRIGISGQQHGIVMWNSDSLRRGILDCSELYNWMYPGDTAAAAKLPKSKSSNVFPGYGMRTLCELSSYLDFDQAHHWDRCGNIMDYFACYLTGSDEVSMSESNALAWGYSRELEWNSEIIPFTPKWMKLPKIVPVDVREFVKMGNCRLPLLEHIPVGVAIADLHASIMSVRGRYEGADHAYLVIGTSSQLCFVVSDTLKLPTLPVTTHVFPFSKGLTLVATASMNGGNALDAILSVFQNNLFFIVASSQPKILLRNVPRVNSVFTAERGSVYAGVEIRGLHSDTSLIAMLVGVCEGVVRNLFGLVPPELFSSLGVERLYLVGNAKRQRFAVHIQKCLDELGARHITLEPALADTSAAYGVALHAAMPK